MHRFCITCKCVKTNEVYGIKLGELYRGEGCVNADGTVCYLIRVPNDAYGPQLYKSEWFGGYFEITSAS